MGFNKKWVTKEMVLNTKEENLSRLFNADALIMDTWSSKFYELYKSGLTKDTSVKMVTNTYGS